MPTPNVKSCFVAQPNERRSSKSVWYSRARHSKGTLCWVAGSEKVSSCALTYRALDDVLPRRARVPRPLGRAPSRAAAPRRAIRNEPSGEPRRAVDHHVRARRRRRCASPRCAGSCSRRPTVYADGCRRKVALTVWCSPKRFRSSGCSSRSSSPPEVDDDVPARAQAPHVLGDDDQAHPSGRAADRGDDEHDRELRELPQVADRLVDQRLLVGLPRSQQHLARGRPSGASWRERC